MTATNGNWWNSTFAKQGAWAVLAVLLLGFIRYDVFVPIRDSHTDFVKAVAKSTEDNAKAARDTADAMKAQTAILERHGELGRENTSLLKEIDHKIDRLPHWSAPATARK